MTARNLKLFIAFSLLLPLAFIGCNTMSTDSDETRYYEFTADDGRSDNYNFIARTSDPDVIAKVEAQLELPKEDRNMFINGKIERGNNGNKNWSWHFIPGEWDLTEAAIEVCDGNPQLVEENIDYWVDDVGRFCPWSSIALREVNAE